MYDEDYGVSGLLCEENACSLNHLLYWLATLNDPDTSGSGDGNIGSGSSLFGGSGDDSGDGNGDLLTPEGGGLSDEPLPVSVTNTLCKASGPYSADIVFPVSC